MAAAAKVRTLTHVHCFAQTAFNGALAIGCTLCYAASGGGVLRVLCCTRGWPECLLCAVLS